MRNHPLDGFQRQPLTIRDIRVIPLSYVHPGKNLWRSNTYQVWKTDAAITQITTEEGLIGIGEGTPYEGPTYIKKFTEDVIRPMIIGKNPFDVELLTNRGTDSRKSRAPWAGVDVACWDLIGKSLDRPVYELLSVDGKPQASIPIYASGGVEHAWYEDGQQQLIEEALRYKDAGYDAFKFRIGTSWHHSGMTLKKYTPILEKLRSAVGPEFRLIHEAVGKNMGSFEIILNDFAPVLEQLGFYWFEEAFGGTDISHIDLYRRLNQALSTVRVSGGERFLNRFEAQTWLDNDGLDIVQTDCNVTGVTENWYIAQMTRLRDKTLIPHNWHGGGTTMANAHLVASMPNREYCELNQTFNPLKDQIFRDPLIVKNGKMVLSGKPGFGVELIDDIEKKFPFVEGSYLKPNPYFERA